MRAHAPAALPPVSALHPAPRPLCRYDTDASGSISYREFAEALFAGDEPATQSAPEERTITGKTCFKDNEWLKGSNGIFDGIFGGGEGRQHYPRPPASRSGQLKV